MLRLPAWQSRYRLNRKPPHVAAPPPAPRLARLPELIATPTLRAPARRPRQQRSPTILVHLPRFGDQVGLIPDTSAGRLLYGWLAAFNQACYSALGNALALGPFSVPKKFTGKCQKPRSRPSLGSRCAHPRNRVWAGSTYCSVRRTNNRSFTANKTVDEKQGNPKSDLTLGNNTGTTWGGNHPK
jgi:hypothetical protein